MKIRKIIFGFILLFAVSIFGATFTACDEEPQPTVSEYTVTFVYGDAVYLEAKTVDFKIARPQDPEIPDGYNFGWYKERRGINLFDFEEEITSDVYVYGVKNAIEYNITYELDGGENDPENETSFTVEDVVLLKPATKLGFSFKCWKNGDTEITKISKGTVGDVTLTAIWELDGYEIVYENTKGADNPNPVSYNSESGRIILQDISAFGYEFSGWYIGEDRIETIEPGSVGEIVLTARWQLMEYELTYEYSGGTKPENPTAYTIESEDITLNPSEKEYYEFVGWFDEFGNSLSVIRKGSYGDKLVIAHFNPVKYDIVYENMEGAINSSKNPAYYDIETEVEFASAFKENYEFIGWYQGEEKIEKIEQGTVGTVTVTARWEPIVFSVSYELDGGENDEENPLEYTVEDEIILKEPTKEYYAFSGWYIGNDRIEKIGKGMSGNLVIKAYWTPLTYNLYYGNLKGATHTNPDTFSEITESITLKKPTNIANYVFEGWYVEGEKVEVLRKNAYHGDITIFANWTPVAFNITYNLNGGTDTTTNPRSYTVEDEFVFQKPYKAWYTFEGWYFYDTKVEGVEKGESGNLVLTAKWTPTVYDIIYYLGGGVNAEENPTTYTVESEDITFAAPTREYYNFLRWQINGETATGIPSGSHNTVFVTAVWRPKAYNIAYENTGNATNPNPIVYNIESNFELDEVSLPERTFEGWYLNGERINAVEPGMHGDMILRAEWTYVEHNVTYMYGGAVVDTVETQLHRAQKIADPVIPEEGYCFAWFTDEGCENQWNFNGEILADTVLYGGILRSYTITYILNGGRNNDKNPTSYTAKERVVIYALSNKPSGEFNGEYVFERWDGVPAGTTFDTYTRELVIPKGTTGDIVLTAVWGEYTYPVQ